MKPRSYLIGGLIAFGLISLAQSPVPTRFPVQKTAIISKSRGLRVYKCHDGDEIIVHILPLDPAHALSAGWLIHEREFLALDDLSMAPEGTNILEFQTICRGKTSEVSSVMVNIIRPIPAPIVESAPARRDDSILPPIPPMPPLLITTLPNMSIVTNSASARDYRRRLDKAAMEGWRRSQ